MNKTRIELLFEETPGNFLVVPAPLVGNFSDLSTFAQFLKNSDCCEVRLLQGEEVVALLEGTALQKWIWLLESMSLRRSYAWHWGFIWGLLSSYFIDPAEIIVTCLLQETECATVKRKKKVSSLIDR